jgi:hypothetical protein
MAKIFYVLLVIIFVSITAIAQPITVHGYVLDSTTHFSVAGAIITNGNTEKKVTSDSKGYFVIQATPNDFLYVVAKTYKYDTLTYSFLFKDTITIYLSPTGNILPAVTVRSQYSKYQFDSLQRKREFEESRGHQLSTLSKPNNSGFGIALNLDRIFKEKYKHKKRSDRVFTGVEQSAYIDYRFSPQLVAYYTGFKGDKLRSFMQRFTPTYEWLRHHPTNEEVMYYINDKLKEFRGAK